MLDWSFPLYRLFGIQVRMHWFYPVLVLGMLGQYPHEADLVGIGVVIMLVQVLVHEYGHCWAAIRVGAGADKILIWPLGGLSFCGAGDTAHDDMFISFMGPAVNSLFAIAAGAGLGLLGLWKWEFIDPFHNWVPWGFSYGQIILLATFRIGMLLTLFNLMVPAYPLDGGRILMTWAIDRYGEERGARVTMLVAIPIGLAMCVWAMVTWQLILLLIGLQVLFEAWQIGKAAEHGVLREHPAFPQRSPYAASLRPERVHRPGWFARWRERRRRKKEQHRVEESAVLRSRVDEVLDKVSREGIGALTPDEKRILEDASRKMRSDDE